MQVIILKYCAVTLQKKAAIYHGFLGDDIFSVAKKNIGQVIFEDFIYFSKYWQAKEARHLQSGFCSLRNPTHSQHEVIAVIFPTNFSL